MKQASPPASTALARCARDAMLTCLAAACAACATTSGLREPEPLPDDLTAVGVSTAVPSRPPVLTDQFADNDPAALTDFREALAPYGSWVDDPTYGTLWVPDRSVVGASFAPYLSAGRWGLTESEAQVWLSDHDDSFGWVVFRYGRWLWTERHGWAWVPGRTYAPAWVVWRAGAPGEPYIGWGPAPPSFLWKNGRAVRVEPPQAPLVVCSSADLFRPDIHQRVLSPDEAAAVVPSMVDFDARSPDGIARPRLFVPDAVAVPARGPSLASGHIPPEAWPRDRHSRADTPNARYATPGGMGRSTHHGVAAGASLKTFVAGGAQVRSHARIKSAYLYVPPYGGGSSAPRERVEPMEDTAVAPTSTALVPVVFPKAPAPKQGPAGR